MNVFEQVAKANGVSEEQVVEEITYAIHCGFSNPEAMNIWKELFPSGKEPSPEEFIKTILNTIY